MNPISDAELALIRKEAAAALDKTCVIQRATRTPVASGGANLVWNTIATVKAGMSQPTLSQLTNYGYLVGNLAAHQVKMEVDAPVLEKDRLLIEGETLTAQIDLTPRSYPILLTILATEVK